MFKVTRFCVQPYVRQKGAVVRGEAMQFRDLADACRARDLALKRSVRVELYEVTGWPVQDLWDRPRKIVGS